MWFFYLYKSFMELKKSFMEINNLLFYFLSNNSPMIALSIGVDIYDVLLSSKATDTLNLLHTICPCEVFWNDSERFELCGRLL